MRYTIGKISQKTGLTTHTLRYYEKEGLLPFVQKNSAGIRVFSENDLGWLSMIECLKATGMPLKGIKQYIDWYQEGDTTLSKRLNMFKNQKIYLKQQIKELQKHLEKIDYKINLYQEAVKQGSLEKAENNKELQKEKHRLFNMKEIQK